MSTGLEVADVFRRHGDAYRRRHDGHLGRVERRVMSAIELCRTAALGGHTEACAACAQSGLGVGQLLGRAGRQHQIAALRRKGFGGGKPDAAAGAGDQGDLARQFQVHRDGSSAGDRDASHATRGGYPVPSADATDDPSAGTPRHAKRVVAQPVSNGTLISGSDRLWRNIQAPSTRA